MREADNPGSGNLKPDLEAFATLYDQYSARIFTYLQYRCPDPATAQDLSAQVFEQVLRSLASYDAQRVPIAVWLFSIARHVVTDWQRKQYLRRFIPWDDISRRPSGEPGLEQMAMESEERRQLRRALYSLSNRERDIIGLRFSSGLTNRAIAGMTGLSESNVAVILFRALRKLRQALDGIAEISCQNPPSRMEIDHE